MAKTITLDHITKIEGHAKLNLGIEKGKVTRCEFSSMEGARYFEGIVVDRRYFEAHEMTSRICGICSCAHVIAALMAVEDVCRYTPSEQTKELRVLLTLGERIRSHATHLYFLALPDYLGYESALAMASKHKEKLKDALQMMKMGNSIIRVLGARDLHPVSAALGGWLKLPTQEQLDTIRRSLLEAKETAQRTCELFFSLQYPDFKTDGGYFSLAHKKEYAILEGKFTSADTSFDRHDYRKRLLESKVPYSSANFVVENGSRYMVGALSRMNNNHERLSKDAKRMLKQSEIKVPSRNPHHNNIAQAIELVHCIDHALRICTELTIKKEEVDKIKPRAGTGVAAIEVPRGTLWHEYTLDNEGKIAKANIITPTTQNLLNIQEDIRRFVPTVLDKKKEKIIMEIEKLIRAYDPCFSCSAHFLEVNWV